MITLTLHFPDEGELVFEEYTTLDINRQRNQFNINATNTENDFAFNATFDSIMEHLGDEEFFSVTIENKRGTVEIDRMTVHYYLTNESEILHFSQNLDEGRENEK